MTVEKGANSFLPYAANKYHVVADFVLYEAVGIFSRSAHQPFFILNSGQTSHGLSFQFLCASLQAPLSFHQSFAYTASSWTRR